MARKLVEAQQNAHNAGTSAVGTRNVQLMHASIVFQLLSRHIQRALLLVSAVLSSRQPAAVQTHAVEVKMEHVDGRLYPVVVKLLATVV